MLNVKLSSFSNKLEYFDMQTPNAGDTLFGILLERVSLVLDQKMQQKHTAAAVLPERTQLSTVHSTSPTARLAANCRTECSHPCSPVCHHLCGSSAGHGPVDYSGSVRQLCAALLPSTVVSPLPLNVSWAKAL